METYRERMNKITPQKQQQKQQQNVRIARRTNLYVHLILLCGVVIFAAKHYVNKITK